jgi:CHAT domain-containing protein
MSHRFKCTTEAEINNIKKRELASVEEANVRELIAQVGRLEELATELEGPVATRPLHAARLAVEQAVTCLDIPAAEPADWDKILEDLKDAQDNLQDRVEAGDEEAISAQATISLLRGILHLFLGPGGEEGALYDRTLTMLDDVEMMLILTRPALSEDWVQLWRVDRIETTIEACKKALELLKIDAPLSNARRAVANITLGNAYFDRVRGDRSDNLRLAIEYLEKGVAPGAKDRERYPRQWALAQQSLGNCYAWSQDFDKARERYLRALEWDDQFETDSQYSQDLATTLNNASIAGIRKWVKVVRGVIAARTLERPSTLFDIDRMQTDLNFRKPDVQISSLNDAFLWSKRFPTYQAVASYNLGRVYEIWADQVRAVRDLVLQWQDDWEAAATDESIPDASEETGETDERPPDASEEAGEAEERPAGASEEAEEADDRPPGAPEEDREEEKARWEKWIRELQEEVSKKEGEAKECYEKCIPRDDDSRHTSQLVELVAARRLGRLHFKNMAWEQAGCWYHKAIQVLERMRGEYITDLGRYALARQNANLYADMAFVCCRLAEDGDGRAPAWLVKEKGELSKDDLYTTALEYLEHGMARLLTEMLVRHDAAPRVAEPERTEEPDALKDLLHAFVERRAQIRKLESKLRNHQAGQQVSQTVEALLEARSAFDRTVALIQQHVPDFVVIPDVLEYHEIVDVVPWDKPSALVYFAITDWGTQVFVVTRGDGGHTGPSRGEPAWVTNDSTLHVFRLDLTRKELDKLLFSPEPEDPVGRWWQTYQAWQKARKARKDDQSLDDAWNQVMVEMEDPPRRVEAGWLAVYQLHRWKWELRNLWRSSIKDATENLYPGLFAEVDAYLKDTLECKRVIFVPQLGLRLLPLHALRDRQGQYLIERYEDIAYTPSAATLQGCRSRLAKGPQRTHFLGVAVGKNREEEDIFKKVIADIADFFRPGTAQPGTQPVLTLPENQAPGNQAKEEDVVRAARDRNFIAFECHGEFNLNDPWKSSLQLGGDDWLELHEVYDKVDLLQARMVTLGACESGLVDHTRPGGEFIGLPGGFLYAGASAVIGSLWKVDIQATGKLMVDTYQNVQKFEMQPSEALCQAQRAMLQSGSQHYRHPLYWAPFYLCGGCEGWWPP